MVSSDYSQEWAEYLDLVERRHGKQARKIAEQQGSSLAGDAAEILRRQRLSWRIRLTHRRNRRTR